MLPEVRGKDRVVAAVRGSRTPRPLARAPITVDFGPGLTATVDVTRDGSFADVFFATYRPPALVPILDAVLQPGDVFFDVGANIGLYSLWAAGLVGPNGRVYAFEPVPQTSDWLQNLLEENKVTNVSVVRKAASNLTGSATMRTTPHASGLSRIVDSQPPDDGESLGVETVRLDDVESPAAPSLVKIDVEGFEGAVVAGMDGLLDSARPAVVFEAPDYGGGDRTGNVVAQFEEHGYSVWSLTTRGLQPFAAGNFTHNLLALHRRDHEPVRARISAVRFPRCQNL